MSLTKRLHRKNAEMRGENPSPLQESQSPLAQSETESPNPTADRLIHVLMNMKNELNPDQQKHPLFFALGKLEKRMTKDLRQIEEDKLKTGMRKIAMSIMWAVDSDGPIPGVLDQTYEPLRVVNGEQ